MEFNWVVIAAIIIFLVFVIIGYIRGFMRSVLSMLSFVIAITFVSIISPAVNSFVENNTSFYDDAAAKVEDIIDLEWMADVALSSEQQVTAIDALSVPDSLKNMLKENNTESVYTQLGVTDFYHYICYSIGGMIVKALVFLFLVVFCILALKLLSLALDIVSRLPVIHGLNKAAGALLGALEGLLALWFIGLLLMGLSNNSWAQQIIALINESTPLSFLYNNNVLLFLILNR